MAPLSSLLRLLLTAYTLQSSLAAPEKLHYEPRGLTYAQANKITENYKKLFLGSPSQDLLDKTVADDYQQYSASLNFAKVVFHPEILKDPNVLGNNNSALTTSKAQLGKQLAGFALGGGYLKDIIPETLNLWFTHDTVIFRSYFHGVIGKLNPKSTAKLGDKVGITSINVLEIDLATLLVKKVYVEFNYLGFLYDLGLAVDFQKP